MWCVLCGVARRSTYDAWGARAAPDGFDFTIRTPGTPPRWVEMDQVALAPALASTALRLCLSQHMRSTCSFCHPPSLAAVVSHALILLVATTLVVLGCGGWRVQEMSHVWKLLTLEARRKEGPDLDKFTELALTFYFYYVNFGPLSRGTAATGLWRAPAPPCTDTTARPVLANQSRFRARMAKAAALAPYSSMPYSLLASSARRRYLSADYPASALTSCQDTSPSSRSCSQSATRCRRIRPRARRSTGPPSSRLARRILQRR